MSDKAKGARKPGFTDAERIDALELAATQEPLLLHDQIITGARGCNHRGLGLLLSTGRTLREAIDGAFLRQTNPPNARDPRLSPMPGDELEVFSGGKTRWWRGVTSVSPGGLRYVTNMGRSRWISLDRWREQMRNAKVLMTAILTPSKKRGAPNAK